MERWGYATSQLTVCLYHFQVWWKQFYCVTFELPSHPYPWQSDPAENDPLFPIFDTENIKPFICPRTVIIQPKTSFDLNWSLHSNCWFDPEWPLHSNWLVDLNWSLCSKLLVDLNWSLCSKRWFDLKWSFPSQWSFDPKCSFHWCWLLCYHPAQSATLWYPGIFPISRQKLNSCPMLAKRTGRISGDY